MKLINIKLWAALLAGLAVTSAALADQDCGQFKVILPNGTTFQGNQQRLISQSQLVNGGLLQVKGTYVEFLVDLKTFTVRNYTLTGAPSENDITGERRTVIYSHKTPQHGVTLTSDIQLVINKERVVLRRAGGGVTMKVDAKDCNQGDIFQVESENRAMRMLHQLAPGFKYQLDRFGRLVFTNGILLGRERPELASRVYPTTVNGNTSSIWQVQANGNVEMLLGDEAREP